MHLLKFVLCYYIQYSAITWNFMSFLFSKECKQRRDTLSDKILKPRCTSFKNLAISWSTIFYCIFHGIKILYCPIEDLQLHHSLTIIINPLTAIGHWWPTTSLACKTICIRKLFVDFLYTVLTKWCEHIVLIQIDCRVIKNEIFYYELSI